MTSCDAYDYYCDQIALDPAAKMKFDLEEQIASLKTLDYFLRVENTPVWSEKDENNTINVETNQEKALHTC